MKKCIIYMTIGAGLAIAYTAYEKELICMCNKCRKSLRKMGLYY